MPKAKGLALVIVSFICGYSFGLSDPHKGDCMSESQYIDELEFKLANALATLNAISEKSKNPELQKFCIRKMNEIDFKWIDKLHSLGIKGDEPKKLN